MSGVLVIGVDAGATTTRCAVATLDGVVVGKVTETAVDAAWRRLVDVHERDADRLLGVAFAYQEADRRAVGRLAKRPLP